MADSRLPDVLIVARPNDYGLSRDAALLERVLSEAGVTVARATTRQRSMTEALLGRRRARIVLHVERAHRRWLGAGDVSWLVPNQERFPRRHLSRLARIDRVLAKTRHAETVFKETGARSCSCVGFTSEDRFDASVGKDWQRFFHMAGGNTLKGTEALLGLWAAHPEWPELVLRQKAENAPRSLPPNVSLYRDYLEDAELRSLQNACGIHLCPSQSEGWGHHILEAMSTGALTLTTDAPPMNEIVTPQTGVLVPATHWEPRHLGRRYYIDTTALERAIETLIAMPEEDKARLGLAGRERYLSIDRGFRQQLTTLLQG